MTGKNLSQNVEILVDTLIRAGCDIRAVGNGYCINEPEEDPGNSAVQEILAAFGPRDHLLREISARLRHLGRVVEI